MEKIFWHNLDFAKVAKMLKTDTGEGLSEREVITRQKKFGENKLPEEKPLSALKIFLGQFQSPLIYVLVIAGIVTIFLHEESAKSFIEKYADSIVIFAAVLLNTIVGFIQENKASQTLLQLKKAVQHEAEVLRDGNLKIVDRKELVPGDIFILNAGDKVPADGILFKAHSLKINEAALTGEWVSAEKTTEILPENTPMADRDNMVYMGGVVEDGKGRAIAVCTGAQTEIGRVANMVKEVKEEKTPYQKKLANFSKTAGIIIGLICFFILILGILDGRKFVEMFTTAVAVAVAAIPEGLPVAMTVILALGMQKILKKKGLVRKLASAETLGSTSIIATDKTGTLTEGKMAVNEVVGNKDLIFKIAVLSSDAFVEKFDNSRKKWILRGRPTDKALLEAGINIGLNKKELEKNEPEIGELPFDPVYKYSATLRRAQEGKYVLYVLGSPEKILAMSKYLDPDGKIRTLSEKGRGELKTNFEDLARKGRRVLATAYKKISNVSPSQISPDNLGGQESQMSNAKLEELCCDLTFVGFVSLDDPVRKGVKEAIEICRQSGTRPIIVTGDHRLTAKAIGGELGLFAKEENIIEGEDLDKLSDVELQRKIESIDIYARVEPRHKIRIVKAWQEQGGVVAMTGDGINDAPALKKADIGVALGSGTEVAKETSDLILLNDSFSIIVAAIEEGRAIIDNIRKVITYLFCSAFTEVALIGVSITAGLPLPILAAQILWINLIEDGPLSLALAFEPKEKGLMKRKPGGHKIPLLTKEMKTLIIIIGFVNIILLLGLFFWLIKYSGYEIFHIRSVIFAGLAIDSIFYIFSCKNFKQNIWKINLFSNKFLIFSWIFSAFVLAAGLYIHFFQVILKTRPLSLFDWQLVFGLGFLNLILVEIIKWFFIAKGPKISSSKFNTKKYDKIFYP